MSLKNAYYRSFQAVFNVGARCLNWRKAEIVKGASSINRIPELLKGENSKKPLVVTDPGLMKCGVADQILTILKNNKIEYALYDQVEANPSTTTVMAIKELYNSSNCDSIIAIGGGSAMDAAKGAGVLVVHPGKVIGDFAGLLKVGKKIPPFIAIPTTAGTGSETTIAAVITDKTTHHKYAVMDLHLIPLYAILDPELTVGLPKKVTSTTGMDALTHAVEAYVCWTYNTKESLRFAEEATKIIFENLEKAYNDGTNIEARMNMQIAAYKAGFAFTRAGVGNVHAIAHTLGGLYNTPHGLANAVILPIVLEDYGSAVYDKLARLAEITGTATTGTNEEKAKKFIAEIRAMNKRMEIPTGFDFIQEKDIPQMCKWACAEANPVYPVPVIFDEEHFAKVIKKVQIPAAVQK